MRFVAGAPRPANAGRKKGSKNKKKIAKVAEVLAEKNLNPAEEILKLIKETDSAGVKIAAWFDLLSYCQAKPKEVDDDAGEDPSEELEETPTETLLQLVKDHKEGS